MNPNTDTLLARLEKVRPTGDGTWKACCPAHSDRTPSLSIKDDGGKILIHCFGGCPVADVVAAVGFELSDLMPPKESQSGPVRQRWMPRQAMEAVAREALIVCLAADELKAGRALSDDDVRRVGEAATRIRDAAREVGCNV